MRLSVPISPPAPLALTEHGHVVRLLDRISRRHLHLDWLSVAEWLAHPLMHAWVIRRNGVVQALVGASVQTNAPDVSWLRILLPAGGSAAAPELDDLWQALADDLAASGVREVAVLVMEQWVERVLRRWGFAQVNAVITLQRDGGPQPFPPEPPITIHPVETDADIDAAAAIDMTAFGPLWRYDRATLVRALPQSATCTLLEWDNQPLAYQLSTYYAGFGHLARLAVLPDAQGQGFGGLLIGEMIRFFAARKVRTISVNTQQDNIHSQHLYQRLGFRPAGRDVPVWMIEL